MLSQLIILLLHLMQTMSVAYEHDQVCFFIVKLFRIIEIVTCQFLYLNYQKLSFKIYFITTEIRLKLQSAKTVFSCFKKKPNGHSGARTTYYHNYKTFEAMRLRPPGHQDTVGSDDDNM